MMNAIKYGIIWGCVFNASIGMMIITFQGDTMAEQNIMDNPEALMQELEEIEWDIQANQYQLDNSGGTLRDFYKTKIEELIARRENLNV